MTPADHPYIKSLPNVEDLSTHLPVFWPDGFARQFPDWLDLRGDFDLADFATIVIHKIFHIWEDTDLPPITVEQVKWAISIVWTRFELHTVCDILYEPYDMIYIAGLTAAYLAFVYGSMSHIICLKCRELQSF